MYMWFWFYVYSFKCDKVEEKTNEIIKKQTFLNLNTIRYYPNLNIITMKLIKVELDK